MLSALIYGMVFLGAALMVYNIYGFLRFARSIRSQKAFETNSFILYIPIILLVMFLLGYLVVGIFGKPDVIMAGILFGGSIFVFIMYLLLSGITGRILANEHLEAKLIAAEESDRAKTRFLASISHEMRTPMNVILGLNSAALRSPDLPPDTREKLEKLGQSGQHLLGLINNILNMNHIGGGALEIQRDPFSLAESLEQVDAIAQPLCDEKGLTYRTVLREGAFGRYLGDAIRLRQVLISILENAVKYTDKGTVTLSVDTAGEENGLRTLRFAVSDTGIGIDSAFLPKVFRVFEQEDGSSTTRFGGTGVSLAVTKNIVELMGGTITVESEKDVGSTFTVLLPLCPVAEEAADEQPQAPDVPLEGRHILIVEDLPENAEIVQDLLELEGVETEIAENGQIALEKFERSQPASFDAILMDLRMPVMDGLEATRRIRALPRPDAKTVPIIALTANAFESDIRASLDAGMDAHLAKPTDTDCLYATIKRLIAGGAGTEGGDAP